MKAILAAAAAAAALSPTPADLAQALLAAEHSPALWATVNACGPAAHPGEVGVRGQMPALGFPAQLEMTISLSYYSGSAKRFRAVPQATRRISLGTVASGTVQDGAAFRFKPPVRLEASVTFEWVRAGRVLGAVTRSTTGGHRDVDDANPAGFSESACTLKS
jgi:hypothetical protein